MSVKRTDRLNSLLREVLSDVIRLEVKNPHVTDLLTVTGVSITRDLRQAKVFVSVIGDEAKQKETIALLEQARNYIAVTASKQVKLRFFPSLHFYLDDSAEKHQRIDTLLKDIQKKDSV